MRERGGGVRAASARAHSPNTVKTPLATRPAIAMTPPDRAAAAPMSSSKAWVAGLYANRCTPSCVPTQNAVTLSMAKQLTASPSLPTVARATGVVAMGTVGTPLTRSSEAGEPEGADRR